MLGTFRTNFSSQLLDVGERVLLNFANHALRHQGTGYPAKLSFIQQVAEPRAIFAKCGNSIMFIATLDYFVENVYQTPWIKRSQI